MKNRVFLSLFLIMLLPTLANASFFNDLVNGDFETIAGKRDIKSWNEDNLRQIKITDSKFMCKNFSDDETYNLFRNGYGFSGDCIIQGNITNESSDTINSIVLNVLIYNKKMNKLVTESRVSLVITVVPTASVRLGKFIYNSELKTAAQQLGKNFSWSYEMIGVVPKGMKAEWLDD